MKIPQNPTKVAQQLGYPSHLFGFTPEQKDYWHEPELPQLTARQTQFIDEMPLDYQGHAAILCVGYLEGDQMAPRFPNGCGVHTMPLFEKAQLVVGRVYTYSFRNEETGETDYEMARLVKIGGTYVEAKADNRPAPSIWLLREEPGQEVWDMREVSHYVSYPDLNP
jgi:hypothetical protein